MADREPRVHDFRVPFWGHALHAFRETERGSGVLSGSCHATSPVREGDVVVWGTPYGHCRGVVEDVTPYMDPDDMYRLGRVRVVERIITAPPPDPDVDVLRLPPLAVVKAPGWEVDPADPGQMRRVSA